MSTRDVPPSAAAAGARARGKARAKALETSFPGWETLPSTLTIPPRVQHHPQRFAPPPPPPHAHRPPTATEPPPYNASCSNADPVLIDNILGLPSAPQERTTTAMADTGCADEAWAAWAPREPLEKVVVDLSAPVRARRGVGRPALAEKMGNRGLRVGMYLGRAGAGKT